MSFFTSVRDAITHPGATATAAAATVGLKSGAINALGRNADDLGRHPVSSSTGGLIGGTSGIITFDSGGAGVKNNSLRGGLSNQNNRYGVIAIGTYLGGSALGDALGTGGSLEGAGTGALDAVGAGAVAGIKSGASGAVSAALNPSKGTTPASGSTPVAGVGTDTTNITTANGANGTNGTDAVSQITQALTNYGPYIALVIASLILMRAT